MTPFFLSVCIFIYNFPTDLSWSTRYNCRNLFLYLATINAVASRLFLSNFYRAPPQIPPITSATAVSKRHNTNFFGPAKVGLILNTIGQLMSSISDCPQHRQDERQMRTGRKWFPLKCHIYVLTPYWCSNVTLKY